MFPVMAALLLLAACDRGTEEARRVETPAPPPSVPVVTEPPVTPAPSPVCANEATIAGDPARQVGGSTSGDVDGDGAADSIHLASDPAGAVGCSAFVVVDVGSSTLAAPTWELGAQGGLPQPRVNSLAQVDDKPGLEVVVDEAAGASTQFVGLYTFDGGDLKRVTISGGTKSEIASGTTDLFPYGGSVGHLDAVDCSEQGGVVISSATPSSTATVYDVTRRFYSLSGTKLKLDDEKSASVPIDQLNRFPEFAAGPFGSCGR